MKIINSQDEEQRIDPSLFRVNFQSPDFSFLTIPGIIMIIVLVYGGVKLLDRPHSVIAKNDAVQTASTDSTPANMPPTENRQYRGPPPAKPMPRSHAPTVQVTPEVTGPSFDCAKARFLDERAICQSGELSFLDRQMASYYRDALKISTNVQKFKFDQSQWLLKRRGCQDNAQCIRQTLTDRIDELSRLTTE